MHTSTISDQTDRRTLTRYDSVSPDKYLSNSSSCIDNRSDLGLDDYNDYEFNYESNNKETTCISTSITKTLLIQLPNVEKQKINTSYTLRQKKFNDKFFPKDLIHEI